VGDVGEAIGDIIAGIKDNAFDPGTDGGERYPRLVTTIEQGGENRLRHCIRRRFDERFKPAGARIDSGVRRAKKDHGPCGLCRSFERAERLRERIDDDDGRAETVASRSRRRCFVFPYLRCSAWGVRPASVALIIYRKTGAAALLVHLTE
jgi:hypothetical protein